MLLEHHPLGSRKRQNLRLHWRDQVDEDENFTMSGKDGARDRDDWKWFLEKSKTQEMSCGANDNDGK